MAGTAWRRGTWYSDCSSSPLLGVKPMRKCGSRSDQGPGTPQLRGAVTGSMPRIGWRSAVGGARAEEVAADLLGPLVDAALDPHLLDRRRPSG